MYGNTYGAYPYYGAGGYNTPSYYQQPTQQQPAQQQPMNTNKLYANGIEDVRCRQLPVNSDYLFLDNDKPLIYRKSTDATGKMDIQIFKIVPYQEEKDKAAPNVDLSGYVSVEQFNALQREFNELREELMNRPENKSTRKA